MIRLANLIPENSKKIDNPPIPNDVMKKLFKQLFKSDSNDHLKQFDMSTFMTFGKDTTPFLSIVSYINRTYQSGEWESKYNQKDLPSKVLKAKLKKYF